MAEEIRVEGKVEEGVIILTIRYGQELLMKTGAGERLSREVTQCYRKTREKEREKVKTTSCIVEIRSEVAGSPLVRALFELWREIVGKESGQVICIDYPQDYIDSLTALGLPSLPGFGLAGEKTEAIQRLIGKQGGVLRGDQ